LYAVIFRSPATENMLPIRSLETKKKAQLDPAFQTIEIFMLFIFHRKFFFSLLDSLLSYTTRKVNIEGRKAKLKDFLTHENHQKEIKEKSIIKNRKIMLSVISISTEKKSLFYNACGAKDTT
jgi:hypothetical protein